MKTLLLAATLVSWPKGMASPGQGGVGDSKGTIGNRQIVSICWSLNLDIF